MRTQTTERAEQKNICSKYITMLAALKALKNSYSGRQFEAQHQGVIRWTELVPETVGRMTFDTQVQSSLRQLSDPSQSRGISI